MKNDVCTDNIFFMAELYKQAHDNNQLLSAMLELTTQCNLKCQHCYIPEHNNYGLSTDDWFCVIEQLRKLGTLNISLTGGEIFLRKDIFQIIEYIRQLNMRVFLLSNITSLTETQIQNLAKMYITEVSTSIYSLDYTIHDAITTIPGSLHKTLQNLFLLKKYGIHVVVKTPLMNINKFAYKDLIEFCKKNDFEFIPGTIIFAKSNGDTSTHSLRISEEDYYTIINDLDGIITKKPFLNYKNEPCAALKYSLAIDSYGDVYPCNSLYYKVGNIKENTIENIWYSSPELKFVKSIEKKI